MNLDRARRSPTHARKIHQVSFRIRNVNANINITATSKESKIKDRIRKRAMKFEEKVDLNKKRF